MAAAPVGDDVYGEDPGVNALEARAAEMVGMEAGLFVASGTMGNLVGILTHATRGDEAIVGQDSHTYLNEAGGMATIGGIVPRPLPTDSSGRMDPADITAAIRADDPHFPRSRLLLVENSYGARGGYPLPPDYFARMRELADRHQLRLHLDGARLFNAVTALEVPATAVTRHVDSVSICVSKGLCAPVGSILCGSTPFIKQARRMRKSVGGGMRQAGVLAAAGLIALEEMVPRLAEDHRRARQLAAGLAEIPGIEVNPAAVKTNMVFFSLAEVCPITAEELVQRLRAEANIWIRGGGNGRFRLVTHYWIGDDEIEQLLTWIRRTVWRGE